MWEVTVLIEVSQYEFEEHQAFKLDESNVIYYDDNTFWLTGVESTDQENVYKQTEARVIVGEGNFDNPELVIKSIVDTSKRITFYDYLLKHHDRSDDFHFNILGFH